MEVISTVRFVEDGGRIYISIQDLLLILYRDTHTLSTKEWLIEKLEGFNVEASAKLLK